VTRPIAKASRLAIAVSIFAAIVFGLSSFALIETGGRDYTGWGPWEWSAACGLLFSAGLLFICCRVVLNRGPAFGIVEGRIEHFVWRDSIPVSEVVDATFERGDLLLRRQDRLTLILRDGSRREVPTLLLAGNIVSIAKATREMLGLDGAPPPLS